MLGVEYYKYNIARLYSLHSLVKFHPHKLMAKVAAGCQKVFSAIVAYCLSSRFFYLKSKFDRFVLVGLECTRSGIGTRLQ